jgi:hypothetical protein
MAAPNRTPIPTAKLIRRPALPTSVPNRTEDDFSGWLALKAAETKDGAKPLPSEFELWWT